MRMNCQAIATISRVQKSRPACHGDTSLSSAKGRNARKCTTSERLSAMKVSAPMIARGTTSDSIPEALRQALSLGRQ